MRMGIAAVSAVFVVGAGLAAVPASAAAPAPVSSISVTPMIDNAGSISVDVSWTGADPSADGVVVCLVRGTSAHSTPDNCESNVAVSPPATSSGPLPIYPAKTYTIAVYDYNGTTPEPTYSAPVSQLRHGMKLTLGATCASRTAGSHCTVTTLLKDVYRGTTRANRPVELWAAVKDGAHWSRVARVTTDSTGHARTTITLDKTRLYQWRYVNAGAHELTTYTAKYQLAVTS